MPELTFRVETSLPGWDHGDVVTVERGPFIEALLAQGRITLLADPESEALDQGDEPDLLDDLLTEEVIEEVVEVDGYVRDDGTVVRAHTRGRPDGEPDGEL